MTDTVTFYLIGLDLERNAIRLVSSFLDEIKSNGAKAGGHSK